MLRGLGAQGLVLDLGHVPASVRSTLPSFLRDLRTALPASARVLLVVPPISDVASQRANAGYDLRDLSRPATLVLRAWGPRPAADGPRPIASLGWYKRTLRYTLAHAPRSRVIVALPTWGAIWSQSGVVQRTQTQLFRLATPAALQQARGARIQQQSQIAWVESDRSLQLKLEVARAAHVAGIALWVRGGESAGVWREPLIDVTR
jgi:spore germination protein YaaH